MKESQGGHFFFFKSGRNLSMCKLHKKVGIERQIQTKKRVLRIDTMFEKKTLISEGGPLSSL